MARAAGSGHDPPGARLRETARTLYGAPRDTFVAQRTAAARELRESGDRELAARVAKLPKPTLVAWAIDQATQQHRDTVEQLVATVARMQAPGSGAELRSLAERHDELVLELARAADRAIGGGRTSDLAAAIRTAAISGDAQDFVDGVLATTPTADDTSLEAALAAGAALAGRARLTRPATNDESDAAADGAADGAAARRREQVEQRRRLKGKLAAARAEQRDATRELRRAERGVDRVERELDDLREQRDRVARLQSEAHERVAELERQLTQLD